MEGSCCHLYIVFLILIAFTTSLMELASAARPAAERTNTEFIRTSCKSTTYPNLCFNSLSGRARTIGVSAHLMAHAALTVSLETARSTSAMMMKAAHGQGMTRKEVGAMHDCVEELSDAVSELRNSIGEMKQLGGRDFDLKMNDIQTWVSAALTNEDTAASPLKPWHRRTLPLVGQTNLE